MQIPWKLYYDDDTTYPLKGGPAGDYTIGKPHGVLCCVVRDPTGVHGRFVNSGYAPHHKFEPIEWYVCYPDSDEPYATHDLAPFRDRMAVVFPKLDPELYIKYGRQTGQIHWQEVMAIASADDDFPTATSPRRRASDFPPV